MVVDGATFRLDLPCFQRRLRRLIAVGLKLGRFQAQDNGQRERSLRSLERHEVRPGEEPPRDVILCAEKSREHVGLLRLRASNQVGTSDPPARTRRTLGACRCADA